VLGIIAKDGCMGQYITLPIENLHLVPDNVSDEIAAFAEPLAAACRVVEQGLVDQGQRVAVVGDGKLGLLIAHVLCRHGCLVTFVGHHEGKMRLVSGVDKVIVTGEGGSSIGEQLTAKFDVVVEASGAPNGIHTALSMVRPLGTLVLKSTCAIPDSGAPLWGPIANDVVVGEKHVIGSRCGPFPPALKLLPEESTQALVRAMLDAVYPLSEGCEAIAAAQKKGSMKVQIVINS